MIGSPILLESGLWRREQSDETDPLRVYPELFNANATGRSVARENASVAPEFEIAETRTGFSLSARAPGLKPAELQVRVTAQLVTVIGKPDPAPAPMTADRCTPTLLRAPFTRTFLLPAAVDARRLKVAFAGDRLTIELPKRAQAGPEKGAQKAR